MTPTWIAEKQVVFVFASGQRCSGRIAVGRPISIDSTEARCPVTLDGFDPSPIALSGADMLQALLLAIQFLGMRLQDFRTKGGQIRDPKDDSELRLEAFFGPLLPAVPSGNTRAARRKASQRSPSHRRSTR